jgi:hypothetical protein
MDLQCEFLLVSIDEARRMHDHTGLTAPLAVDFDRIQSIAML